MAKYLYKLLFAWIYLLSLLPFWMLHGLSNFIFLVVYYLIGYRKKRVHANLELVFPEKSPQERKKIAKDFYLHLCDLIIESIKSVSMTQKEFKKRYQVSNWSHLVEVLEAGHSPILISPHSGNWEWVFSLVEIIPVPVYAVYQPLKNPHFDQYIRDTRQRYGAIMISMKETFKRILEAHKEQKQILSWFASDQACRPEKAQWLTFLGQDTTFHKGYEELSRQTGNPIIFFDIKKTARSKYLLTLTTVCENANDIEEGEAVREFARLTELRIRETPAAWLWSHNRWKYQKPA